MINLAWGGLSNGRIDTSLLVDVSGRGDYLERTAAAQFLAMRNACFAGTGHWINPAPGSSAYRPYATQVSFYAAYQAGTGNVAAVPGTSNHGWGRAVDITGYEGNDLRRGPSGRSYRVNAIVWDWLIAHAGAYGYSWGTGDASGEAWHWESLNTPGTTTTASSGSTPIREGFLMALTDAEQAEVLNCIRQLFNADFNGGPSMKDGGKSIVQSIAEIHGILTLPIDRGGVKNSQIQELADTKTIGLELLAQVGALQHALGALALAQGVDPKAIQDAAKAGAEQALAGLTLKPVTS